MIGGIWDMVLGLAMLAGVPAPPIDKLGFWGWVGDVVQCSIPRSGASHADPSHVVMACALRGLELIFFAPLPFALMKVVCFRLNEIGGTLDFVEKERTDLHSASSRATDTQKKALVQANQVCGELEIVRIKITTLHLMAAIVATDMVNRATGEGLKWEIAVCEVLLIAALVGFSVILRKHFLPEEPLRLAAGS
jgi:hypothetical protein